MQSKVVYFLPRHFQNKTFWRCNRYSMKAFMSQENKCSSTEYHHRLWCSCRNKRLNMSTANYTIQCHTVGPVMLILWVRTRAAQPWHAVLPLTPAGSLQLLFSGHLRSDKILNLTGRHFAVSPNNKSKRFGKRSNWPVQLAALNKEKPTQIFAT